MTISSPTENGLWSPEMGSISLSFDGAGSTEEERKIQSELEFALESGDLTAGLERFTKLNVLFVLRTLLPAVKTICNENVRMLATQGVLQAYTLLKKGSEQELRNYLGVSTLDDLRVETEDLCRCSAKIESDVPMPEIPYDN